MSNSENDRRKVNKIAILILIIFLLLCFLGAIGYYIFSWYGGFAADETYSQLTESIKTEQTIEPGERVAQFVITPVITPCYEEVTELSDTDRGFGGFGSTGK